MKKDTLYLIIAGIIAWLLYRNYKKKHQTAGNADVLGEYTDAGNSGGSWNGGGGTQPNPNITTEIPPTPPSSTTTNADEDRLYPVVTTEKCPYCGTPNAIVTRWYESGEADNKPVKIEVECGNKSCPGSALGGGVISKSLIKTNKFVTAS
ncbi:MAG: hypothetical protein II817_00670 [Bacteroidales bacterium]|nr:hypothetical protein [Bacteroidales bacterium]